MESLICSKGRIFMATYQGEIHNATLYKDQLNEIKKDVKIS